MWSTQQMEAPLLSLLPVPRPTIKILDGLRPQFPSLRFTTFLGFLVILALGPCQKSYTYKITRGCWTPEPHKTWGPWLPGACSKWNISYHCQAGGLAFTSLPLIPNRNVPSSQVLEIVKQYGFLGIALGIVCQSKTNWFFHGTMYPLLIQAACGFQ